MLPNDCALAQPKFLTIAQFCQRYQVSRSSAYRAHHQGAFLIVKWGRSSRIAFDQAEVWAASLPVVEGRA